jgi:hypothetical protein
LSLEVIAAVLADPSLAGWDGFGLAVQAYQKRALAVIGWVEEVAAALDRRLTVRLVKGAYWDTEIKRAQERGLPDYPVFTRKAMTDLCFTACVKKLLAARNRLYPQFATHNALTVSSVIEDAGGVDGFEFQRLYGMGEALYRTLIAEFPDAVCRVYAPVGGHRDLLAYLVRRLLENGANSSFVSVAADPKVPIADILRRPQSAIGNARNARNPNIPLPRDLYRPERRNSRASNSASARASTRSSPKPRRARCGPRRAAGRRRHAAGRVRAVISPIDGHAVGTVIEATKRSLGFGDGGGRVRLSGLGGDAGRRPAPRARARRRSLEESRGRCWRSCKRRRQDARRRARRAARGHRLLPLLCRPGAPPPGAGADAGADRREQRAPLSRPRRLRVHQPVEFSAGDLPRPGDGGARRRQCGGGQAGGADAA